MEDMRQHTCPHICPGNEPLTEDIDYPQAGELRNKPDPSAAPYIPGMIQPPEKKIYPPGAPPPYLPQPTDSTSGDILTMGPIGPWAPGHVDWSPQAGMTGVRPVVDKYSITRYSTGEWRKHNEAILKALPTDKGRLFGEQCKKELDTAFKNLDNKQEETNRQLNKRIKDVSHWKKMAEKAQKAMVEEVDALDADRMRLKGASRILMMPEAISRECLELRTNRLEPDLVRDEAEQELIKEVAIVGEIRRVFNNTLAKVDQQINENRAAKAAIENDWNDKKIALAEDINNRTMGSDSTLIRNHPGVARWPENATSLEYWEHFCRESIRNCDEVRKRSAKLRADLMNNIVKGSQDMKIQADRTNQALGETVAATEALCEKLEEKLKDNLQKIADVENLMDYLKDSLRNLDQKNKLCMTRLQSRNYHRPNVENCRDEAQYALMAETKFVKETIDSFKDKLRQADAIRAELMKYRGDLEKEIACKRKSLNIDKDRCSRVRAHMPTPEEFAAG